MKNDFIEDGYFFHLVFMGTLLVASPQYGCLTSVCLWYFKYIIILCVCVIVHSAYSVVGTDKATYYYNPCKGFTEKDCVNVAVR